VTSAARKQKTKIKVAPLNAVTEALRSYAARGVFSEFSERPLAGARTEYRFLWLTSKPIQAVYDSNSHLFKLVDVLPAIPLRSKMDRALREFLIARRSPKLLAHRRLSLTLIPTLRCINKGGSISLALTLNPRRTADATRQVVNLVSEIFQNFLAGPYHEYMVQHFGVSED